MENVKKELNIYMLGFKYGGVERVFLNIFNKFDFEKYSIRLFIFDEEDKYDKIFEEISKSIKINSIKYSETIKKISNYIELNKESTIFFQVLIRKLLSFIKILYIKKWVKNNNKKSKACVNIAFFGSHIEMFAIKNFYNKIVWVHSNPENFSNTKIKRILMNCLYRRMDKIIVLTEEMKGKMEYIYPKIKDKLIVIPNGIDIKKVQELSEETLDFTNYILMIARLDEKSKDYKTLIEAYKILKEVYFIKEKLVIIGDGDDKNLIEDLIKKNNLQNEILMIGNIKNPYKWIKNSKLLVHSSKYEGFGMVLLEGLVLEKKIISTDFKYGAREILQNGKYGKIVKVGDKIELSKSIFEFLNEKEKLVDIQDYIQKYNQVNIIRQISTLFCKGDK